MLAGEVSSLKSLRNSATFGLYSSTYEILVMLLVLLFVTMYQQHKVEEHYLLLQLPSVRNNL